MLAAGEATIAADRSAHYAAPFALLRDDPGAILDHPQLMGFKNDRPGLAHDPLGYQGGPLRYTPPIDHRLRAASGLLAAVEALATRHGRLPGASPKARRLTAEWDRIG